VATPLLVDVDGDGFRDIVAPSSSGEVWAVHGENGHVVDNWPFYVEGRSFFASPLSVSQCILYHIQLELTNIETVRTALIQLREIQINQYISLFEVFCYSRFE
jgi:hypothetical protein